MPTLIERLKYAFTGKPAQESPAPATPAAVPRHRSKVDAAQTNEENRRHWANADFLGPNAAFDADVCAKLRSRSRYEALNGSYLKSLIKTVSYDLIGTSPRPEFKLPGDADGELGKAVESKFAKWSRVNLLGRNLRVLHKSAVRDGAGFAVLTTDPDSPDPVQLTVRLIESDQCVTPPQFANDPMVHQGKRVNGVGRPTEYYFLRRHPGELGPGARAEFAIAQARFTLHWYEQDRAGQQNGIPQTTPALPLFAQLRRYSQAVLTAAEVAAMIAGVLKSTMATAESAVAIDDWESFEMVRGALMTLPDGWEASQFKPEQPTTNYPDYERTKLNEAGRSVNAPLNVTTGNSSGYNFSSGRLDHLPYQRGAWIDRDEFEQIVFDPIVSAWAEEATQIAGYLPAGLPPLEDWTWSTNWDGFDEIDQVKSASADDQRLRNGTTTLATIAAQR
ncbi:MAG: phage portal protein, partial [Betaproteobacteria bacterium]|nr:phage portal protein [Betaproteobacteria bacterium]